MFKVLDIDRSGVLNKEEFVRTLKSAVKEAGDQFKNKRAALVRKVAEVQPKLKMPFAHLRTMFRERLKAFMMQDRTVLRDLWRKYDVDNLGVLNVSQLADLIRDCDIHVPDPDQDSSDSEAWSIEEFMSILSGGRKTMFYQDFVANILGLPGDFFTMKVVGPGAGLSHEENKSLKEQQRMKQQLARIAHVPV